MLGLVSTSSGADAVGVLKAALPIGIGLASAAYLTLKMTGQLDYGLAKVRRLFREEDTDDQIPLFSVFLC